MKCARCNGETIEKEGNHDDGVTYHYYSCTKCGEKFLDMDQLHEVAEKYRQMKKYKAKVSQWGDSIAIRIPKELAIEYKLKPNQNVNLIPENKAIRIVT